MTAAVIDFAATLDARRAAVKAGELQIAHSKRNDARRQQGYEAVDRDPLLMHVVDAVCDKLEQQEATAATPMPAYCDPANETQGSKYRATRDMSRAEIAARIRRDIKDALKAKRLPPGIKVSVRTRLYSGGGSIDVKITALPAGFRIWNPEYVTWRRANPHDGWPPFTAHEQRTPEYHDLIKALEQIHGAYNRDNSDGMTDYFDRRYYGDVGIDWRLERAMREAEGM